MADNAQGRVKLGPRNREPSSWLAVWRLED